MYSELVVYAYFFPESGFSNPTGTEGVTILLSASGGYTCLVSLVYVTEDTSVSSDFDGSEDNAGYLELGGLTSLSFVMFVGSPVRQVVYPGNLVMSTGPVDVIGASSSNFLLLIDVTSQ